MPDVNLDLEMMLETIKKVVLRQSRIYQSCSFPAGEKGNNSMKKHFFKILSSTRKMLLLVNSGLLKIGELELFSHRLVMLTFTHLSRVS